jgi:hypothetical protein
MMRKLGIVVIVVMAFVVAASGGSQASVSRAKTAPAVDLSATPTGWVPVAFGYMQVSVPPNWDVLDDSPPCPTGSAPGEMFVNPIPGVFRCPPNRSGRSPQTVVQLRLEPPGVSVPPSLLRQVRIINDLGIYLLSDNSGRSTYLVIPPVAEITLKGPLALRVLNTLTLSPRFVASPVGPAPSVPSSWRGVRFAGLRFSETPARRPVWRSSSQE